jgi:hypothetical protein
MEILQSLEGEFKSHRNNRSKALDPVLLRRNDNRHGPQKGLAEGVKSSLIPASQSWTSVSVRSSRWGLRIRTMSARGDLSTLASVEAV